MTTINLKSNERLDDLCRNGYKLIQNTSVFCFGMDAVLLSTYAMNGIRKGNKVLDLGTGNGIIPILLEAKSYGSEFTGLEIQDINVDLATRNVEINNLSDKIHIVQGDIKEASKIFAGASFDVITTNPPYMNENHGLVSLEDHKAIARHEILCTLDDVLCQASKLLKVKGRFYMVHRPSRLTEIMERMNVYKLEPKRIVMVHPHINEPANMVLIEAVKCGNRQLKIEAPLIVYNEDGSYTEELLHWYNVERGEFDGRK